MLFIKFFKGKDIDFKIVIVELFLVDSKEIKLVGGIILFYDVFVVVLGSKIVYFGILGLEENSMVLKFVVDVNKIYKYVEDCICEYVKMKNEVDVIIVIGGGGLIGVELVGEFVDIMFKFVKSYGVNLKEVKFFFVEVGLKIFLVLLDYLIECVIISLEVCGVIFLIGFFVINVVGNEIDLKDG